MYAEFIQQRLKGLELITYVTRHECYYLTLLLLISILVIFWFLYIIFSSLLLAICTIINCF